MLERWLTLRDWLTDAFIGGPKVSFATVINLQKGTTLPVVLARMAVGGDGGPTAWTYAALHGGYGLCWLLKEALFPDPGWRRSISLSGAALAWLFVLGPYWLAPWLIVRDPTEAPAWLLGASTLVVLVGLALMIGADAQKYFVLRQRPGLITDGFFARTRNPNYLGEMLIYGGFAALARHPLPWLVLAAVWTLVFLPNMLNKDRRMARHPGFDEYRARTGLLLPRLGTR